MGKKPFFTPFLNENNPIFGNDFHMTESCQLMTMYCTTVIPWFTRLPWQPKNRVNLNLRYTNHSIDKKINVPGKALLMAFTKAFS